MPDQYRSRDAADVLRDLHSYVTEPLLDTDSLSDEQVRIELSRRGIPSVPSFRAIHDLLDEKIAAAQLVTAKRRRMDQLAAINTARPVFGDLRDKLQNLIRSFSPQTASVYWSRFESADEEDLQSLYEDLIELNKNSASPESDEIQ